MKTLVTKRLILRQLKLTDLEDLYDYAKNEKIGPMAGWPRHKSIETTYKILKMLIKEDETWAITLKNEDRLIGTIGLTANDIFQALNNTKELGFVLRESYWGKGIVKEAADAVINYGFVDLELGEIICGHYPYNKQSQRVIEKLNFKYINTEVKEDYKGDPIDVMYYKINRAEYLERRFKDDNIR